jgi:hypothetical protein
MKYYFWCADIYDAEGDLISKPSGTMSMEGDGPPDEAFEALQQKLAEAFPDCTPVVIAFNNVL